VDIIRARGVSDWERESEEFKVIRIEISEWVVFSDKKEQPGSNKEHL